MANQEKIILGFVGEIASGKGTSCNYLIKKYKANYYRFSDPLRDILNILYIKITRSNMQKLSTLLRKNFSENILAKIIAEKVKKDNYKFIVIDGIRRFADIAYLKENKAFHLIYITADIDLRYKRNIKRGENINDKQKTFEEFKKDDNQESENEIKKVGKTAEFKIENNSSFENLYQNIEEIIKTYS